MPWRREDATATTDRTAWTRNLAAPIRDFLSAETASALVLLAAAVVALVWANTPWWHSYESFWSTEASIRVGAHAVALDLRGWVNDGLMTLFFLVIGLEAKRELDMGELRERGRIATPVVAAIGGMLVPVAIYLAVNAGSGAAHGWGVAMSTDTALALGALTLLAPPGASRLRVVLLTIVVVDDLVALVVITIAYSQALSLVALAIAVGLFAVLVGLRYAPAWRRPVALVVGLALWLALHESGVDPLVGGLAAGLAISAYPPSREGLEQATAVIRSFREQPTPELARSAQRSLAAAISPNERLQHRLHPWTSLVIVPLFALANFGIHVTPHLLAAAVTSTVTIGIALGYVVGKPVGILAASFVAQRSVARGRRMTVTWPGLGAVGAVAGMGFTVSLLIASLAFTGERFDEARLGIVGAVVIAPGVAWLVFRLIAHLPSQVRARQIGRTAGDFRDLVDEIDPDRDHIRGPADATVTLLEYGDFECTYCGKAEAVIRELTSSFGDDLQFVFRHLPLNDVHPSAQIASEAAEAAGAQGKFWEMYDILLSHQGHLAVADLRAYAKDLGLDVERFWDDVRTRRFASRVADDVATADASGVSGTPTFFINGRRRHGAYDIDALTEAVRGAGARARNQGQIVPRGSR